MTELRVVSGYTDGIMEYVMTSEMGVADTEQVVRKMGYAAVGTVYPDAAKRMLEYDEAKQLLIDPKDIDRGDSEIIPLMLVRVPAKLGRLAAKLCTRYDFKKNPTAFVDLATNIRGAPMAYTDDGYALSTTRDSEGNKTGLHIDGYDVDFRFLCGNPSQDIARFHCVSDYMVRENGDYFFTQRIQHALNNPPRSEDRVLWLYTPPSSVVETNEGSIQLDYAWISPVTRILHDGSRQGIPDRRNHMGHRVRTSRNAYLYSVDADTMTPGKLPSPLYPRPEDQVILEAWTLENSDITDEAYSYNADC